MVGGEEAVVGRDLGWVGVSEKSSVSRPAFLISLQSTLLQKHWERHYFHLTKPPPTLPPSSLLALFGGIIILRCAESNRRSQKGLELFCSSGF